MNPANVFIETTTTNIFNNAFKQFFQKYYDEHCNSIHFFIYTI